MQIRMKEINLPSKQEQIYDFKMAAIKEEYNEWTTGTKPKP